jgi:hypothetical protein
MEELKMEKIFSPEEINELNKKTDPKDLEEFFFEIFVKKGDNQEEARKMAQEWAQEMTSNKID